MQLYEIDARTLGTVYATIASVFPHVEAWEAGGGDLVLVGAKKPTHLSGRCARRPHPGGAVQDGAAASPGAPSICTGLLAHFLANEHLARVMADGSRASAINTDDRNVVEFGFARSVGSGASLLAELRQLARTAGHERPAFPRRARQSIGTRSKPRGSRIRPTEQHLAGVEAPVRPTSRRGSRR